MKKLAQVSITITTKNEEYCIESCLKSIKTQTYLQKYIEIVVVDNNSSDKTKQIAKKYTPKVYNFGPERSAQRNFGMLKKSQGKYLMFLDADMTLNAKTIKSAVQKLEHTNLIALYIPEKIIGNSFWSQVRNFERQFYDATVIDGLRFFKRNVFVKTGGFDEKLHACEDWDLDKRIRKLGNIGILSKNNDELIYHNDPKDLSLKSYLSKKSYYSSGCLKYIKKWGGNDKDIQKQFGFSYRYLQVFLENNKWQKFLSRPVYILGFYFMKICLGLVYIFKKLKK
jgi:glycosyltransferase involved in cell wall biosynthesis